MRTPGQAAKFASPTDKAERAIEELEQKPPAKENQRGHFKDKEEGRKNRFDAGVRKEAKIGAHHRRDRAARADGRQGRISVRQDVKRAGRQSANHVKNDESSAAKLVLVRVAENP